MADWSKLNKKFDEVLDNLTDEDWDRWMNEREEENKSYRELLELKTRTQTLLNELKS